MYISYLFVYACLCTYMYVSGLRGSCFICICLYLYLSLVYVRIVCICTYLYVLYVCVRIYVSVSIVRIWQYKYVYVSICMYVCTCSYCTYMYVYVCISQGHIIRYMQIRSNTDNTYIYVYTYRICIMCKCTYLFVFMSKYDTIWHPFFVIRTNTYNMVHWWSPARGFADDLVIVTSAAADLSSLLQVVADFCAWSGMRIKREKSVVTGFDFRLGTNLPTAGILMKVPPWQTWRLRKPLHTWALWLAWLACSAGG